MLPKKSSQPTRSAAARSPGPPIAAVGASVRKEGGAGAGAAGCGLGTGPGRRARGARWQTGWRGAGRCHPPPPRSTPRFPGTQLRLQGSLPSKQARSQPQQPPPQQHFTQRTVSSSAPPAPPTPRMTATPTAGLGRGAARRGETCHSQPSRRWHFFSNFLFFPPLFGCLILLFLFLFAWGATHLFLFLPSLLPPPTNNSPAPSSNPSPPNK